MNRRTKIVATLGPASEARLDELIGAGVSVFRLNLSHGTVDEHLERLVAVRAAARRLGRDVGVLADLPGPKIRAAGFPTGGVMLVDGAEVVLVEGETASTAARIEVDYPGLARDVRAHDTVIIGDGAISIEVVRIDGAEVVGTVRTGGLVQGRPGVHLPAERSSLRSPTAEDLELLVTMVAADVDFIAVSFVREAEDLRTVRMAVTAASPDGRRPMIVAKIETAPAIANLHSILQVTDAVMVARGDLGIECPLEDVPHLQKQVIRACVTAGVPVITATQMLESMITSPAPTRAEASDVANAVFDGTDALMLSGETAIGHDPVLVVQTMAKIAHRAEMAADYRQWGARIGRMQRLGGHVDATDITLATTHAAWQAAGEVGAAAILCCTRSGRTGREAARFRPMAEIIGLSPSVRTRRQLALSWGVEPLAVETSATTDEVVWFAVQAAVASELVQLGELVVVLAGAPDSDEGATDVMRIVRLK
jgi:pyruvate kinase